ncbi:T9SS type A sorting domain-containing protein [Neolewinella agarilytica]|uniref:Por secretion system C-terminal sorting domain-containing protein n=1 Tax=Neolewinella agarilytica TaxID=478744 RepID=A0A1H9H801_9BACT|nr:T9SS type A sorting domain-containing protein [Neolewinella agarilytica]SEQ58489.1 Por secretion system C-terminal sorting domain-containing protein [Neolewinella agarilytica]
MKHSLLLFLLLLLIALSLPANAQTGCNTGVTLTTQADVDAFSHTGVFDGSIAIGDLFNASDITNLDALSGVTGITNALSIINNPLLTDISGLSNLTFLGQNPCQSQRLTISTNPLLADLSPLTGMAISPSSRSVSLQDLPEVTSLSSLSGITGCRDLKVTGLGKLTNLAGLDNLAAVTFIEIRGNALLTNIDALTNVTASWNPGNEGIQATIEDNPLLNNLNGLSGMTNATIVEVANCDALTDLTGMGNLTSILGKLDLQDNDGLTNLEGLSPDLIIGTLLVLRNNSQLASCAYNPVCDQIAQGGQFGQVDISGNAAGCADVAQIEAACNFDCGENAIETFTTQEEVDAFTATYGSCRHFLGEIIVDEPMSRSTSATPITNLNALSNLRQIGVLRILNAPNLNSLSGLTMLDSINGDLDIRNTAIVDLSSLSSLHKLGGRLDIAFNPVLERISSFTNVSSVANSAVIRFNPLLEDMSGFSNLVTVGDVLQIITNPSLPDLADFSSLRFSFDGLTIDNNDMLTSLAGLETLENINAGLRILNNDLLSDISTLNNLDQATIIATSNGAPGTAALVIRDNPLLSNCAIETVCTFLDGSGTAVDIQGNALNCESQTVVENNCLALPVSLLSFTATDSGKTVSLNWKTTSEENTQNFLLERSVDGGRTFVVIGSVAARNQASGAAYTLVDESAYRFPDQYMYYRLRVQDFDSSQQLFGPVVVEIPAANADDMKIFPNPMASQQMIRIQGAAAGAKIDLMAMDGRRLSGLAPMSDGQYQLPGLVPGVYLIRIAEGKNRGAMARFVVR